MPNNLRSNRNAVILSNALKNNVKLACARKLDFDMKRNDEKYTHEQQLHEDVFRVDRRNNDDTQETTKCDSLSHAKHDQENTKVKTETDLFNELNLSSIEFHGGPFKTLDAEKITLNTDIDLFEGENINSELWNTTFFFNEFDNIPIQTVPANERIELIHDAETISSENDINTFVRKIVNTELLNTNVIVADVHDEPITKIPANKRIKLLDVQVIKAPENLSHYDDVQIENASIVQNCIQDYTIGNSEVTTENPSENDKIQQSDPEILRDSEGVRDDFIKTASKLSSNDNIQMENPCDIEDIIQEYTVDITIENLNGERNELERENPEVLIESDLVQKGINKNNANKQDTRKRTSERKPKEEVTKCYFDYISDDDVEEYVWESSSWEGSVISDSESEHDNTAEKKKSKKKSKRQKVSCKEDGVVGKRGFKKEKQQIKKQKSIARNQGQAYKTSGGGIAAAKQMKPNPCINAKKCPYKCYDISEEKRNSVFTYFNGLNLQKKRDWLVAMTLKELPKRKKDKNAQRRVYSYLYFINDGEGRRQICLRFLLNTLDTTQRFVHYTLSNLNQGSALDDLRGKKIPPNKTKPEAIELVKQFIMNLPAVPSHYCRKDSSRVYLPSEMKNITNVYEKYKIKQQNDLVDYVGEKVFRKIFTNDFNIGIHVPKKDKCQKCVAYNEIVKTNVQLDEKTQIEKEKHDQESKACDARFKFHKTIRLRDEYTLCVSFDMQKVLNTPMGDNMLLFYSRKYAVYNLTFYESITRNGYCYTWGESEGKRGANEVATILVKYVEEVDRRNEARHLLLYSDSCPGQNKNKTVLAALHYILQKCNYISTIQMNFLLPGHTMMPVDSMHAVIENSITGMVWAPSQWATIFQLARKSFGPYNVSVLDHTDFMGYDKMSEKYFKGNLTGKISKLTTVTLKKGKPILVKYSMQQESQAEKIEVVGSSKQLLPIYKSNLPISEKKYNDLKQLCDKNIIPRMYHSEYKNLRSKNIQDALNESDEEDTDLD